MGLLRAVVKTSDSKVLGVELAVWVRDFLTKSLKLLRKHGEEIENHLQQLI